MVIPSDEIRRMKDMEVFVVTVVPRPKEMRSEGDDSRCFGDGGA